MHVNCIHKNIIALLFVLAALAFAFIPPGETVLAIGALGLGFVFLVTRSTTHKR